MAKKKSATSFPFVIVRSYSAGVFAGELVNKVSTGDRQRVTLNKSRRLWKWKAKEGVALSGVAAHGIVLSESKVDAAIDQHEISEVIEILPASIASKESIYGVGK